jgi:membrane-associated phospholipid phosphatase
MRRDLHPTLLHLLLALFTLGCFGLVAEQVSVRRPVTTFDVYQAERIHQYGTTHARLRTFAAFVTDLGSGPPRIVVIAAVSVILLAHRQWRLALFFVATQWLLKEIVGYAKETFERPRPPFSEIGGWSFPSGHATGAMATYGMIAYLVALRWPERRFRWALIAVLAVIILSVGMSRMLLGVHYFTDVAGGYLLGLAYTSLCVAGIELARSVRSRDPRPACPALTDSGTSPTP